MTGFSNTHLKIPLILAILIFMSSLNVMLSRVKNEKFYNLGDRSFFVVHIEKAWVMNYSAWVHSFPMSCSKDSY